jgi:malate synthase
MNMTATQNLTQEHDIREEISYIAGLNQTHVRQIMDYSKAFLDKVFPLQRGSHKDVCSYVVYYQHLLAFFADGSNSGLKTPAQFVAFGGHPEQPQSLVLKDGARHVELLFCHKSADGAVDKAGIEDIQLQLKGEQEGWFSMIRGNTQIQPCLSGSQNSPCFRAKEGGDYRVN